MTLRIPFKTINFIPKSIPETSININKASLLLSEFLKNGYKKKTAVLTGAGISVPSGIPAYRGPGGVYTERPKTYRPIFHNEFISKHHWRQRYWARSFIGWGEISGWKYNNENNTHSNKFLNPNIIHTTIGELYNEGYLSGVVTQNVDSLHISSVPSTVELHGALRNVICLGCNNIITRDELQYKLSKLNPLWTNIINETYLKNGKYNKIPLNPDGDVELGKNINYKSFRYPACTKCASKGLIHTDNDGAYIDDDDDNNNNNSNNKYFGILKPKVVFFGGKVDDEVRLAAEKTFQDADRILIIGTSLATASAFRLVLNAKKNGKRLCIISLTGVREEELLMKDIDYTNSSHYNLISVPHNLRFIHSAEKLLPMAYGQLQI